MVNYTIRVTDKTLDQSNRSANYTLYESYRHLGPGTVRHAIISGLERDKEYSMIVDVRVEPQVIQSYNGVVFSKLLIMVYISNSVLLLRSDRTSLRNY